MKFRNGKALLLTLCALLTARDLDHDHPRSSANRRGDAAQKWSSFPV